MSLLSRKAYTIIEILITSAILGVVFLIIYQIFWRGGIIFNERLWEGQTVRRLDITSQYLKKYLQIAAYPSDNTFNGVIRDMSAGFDLVIAAGNLSSGDAYSEATQNLAGNDINRSDGTLELAVYFGSGVDSSHTADSDFDNRLDGSNAEQDILQWVGCQPGYKDMPGFADAMPRCSQHRLFLKNRQQVIRANPKTYLFYQDLILESKFSITNHLTAVSYAKNEGRYSPAWSTSGSLTDEEKNIAGRRLLASHVATVVVRVFQNPNERGRAMELDIVAVSPNYGNAVVRKTFQESVSTKVRQ